MAAPDLLWKNGRFGQTSRRDTWWLEPLLVFLGLGTFLVYDAIKAFFFADGFGIGVGTLVLCVNAVLLAGYIFGCHAFRHTIGGRLDSLAGSPVRHKLYDCASCLNSAHKKWAWASLFSVGFADIYVRLCSMGIWSDWRIL